MAKRDQSEGGTGGVTRRGFISGAGAGAVAAATLGRHAEAVPEITAPDEMVQVALSVNGRTHRLLVEPRWTLLFVLRERLGFTGTKVGCARGECGACTVLIDDQPRYACLTLTVEAEGHRIETIEGLMDGEQLGTMQQAFVDHDAFQCGYCTPGQIMAAEGLVRAVPDPSEEEVRHAMSGNICRCAAYAHIFEAVADAASRRKGGSS